MRTLFFVLSILTGYSGTADCQTTFNKRERYHFLACVLTSIHPTDSCYYATGIIADTLPPYNTGAIFLKLSLDGELLILKTVKSTTKTYEPWFNDLLPLADGSFMVDGVTIDSVEKTLVIKYNDNGDTIFTKEYLHPAFPSATFIQPRGGIMQLSNGGFVIANWVEKSSGNDEDILLTWIDGSGNIIQEKTFSSPMVDYPSSVLLSPGGKIIVGGLRDNLNTNTEDFIFQVDIFQVDSLGNKEWEYLSPISAGLRDAANDMLLLDDGSLIVASGIGHEQVQSSLNSIYFDRYVFKLNPQHQLEWELTFPDSALTTWSRTTKIIKLADGSGFVLGGMEYLPKQFPTFKQPVKGWLAKISQDGDSVWTRRYAFLDNTLMANSIYDMKQTPDGGLIICGESLDYSDGATFPQQGWLLKLDEHGCLVPGCHLSDATEEQAPKTEPNITIYPIPTTDYLNFYINAPTSLKGKFIRIIDTAGRMKMEFKADSFNSTFIVPVWDWASGTYWAQLVSGNKIVSTEVFIKTSQ